MFMQVSPENDNDSASTPVESEQEPAVAAERKRFLWVLKSANQFLLLIYVLLFGAGIALAHFELLGMLPALLIMSACIGATHLAYTAIIDPSDNYLDDLHAERGRKKKKRVVFFISN